MTKPKPVNWQIIEEDHLYTFVSELIEQFHGGDKEIGGVGLNFVLMWRHNVKMDQDGYIVLADVTKSSDQNRELRPHDVIIGINKDAWSILTPRQKQVVIDSQLERIAVCLDKDDNPKEDDRGRIIFRLRRIETVDGRVFARRHAETMQEVQECVYSKFKTGGAEEGSYVADQLVDEDD
jgi:hypothetical protein